MKSVSGKQFCNVLRKHGWELKRIRGSHHILAHPKQRRALTVPVHGRDLKTGTLTGILRVAGITREELRELLGR